MNATLFLMTGGFLVVAGLYHLLSVPSVFRKLLAANVLSAGIFMILIALAARQPGAPDPVPHAMVLTGIVVSVCVTAVGLKLICRLHALTGSDELPRRGQPSDDRR